MVFPVDNIFFETSQNRSLGYFYERYYLCVEDYVVKRETVGFFQCTSMYYVNAYVHIKSHVVFRVDSTSVINIRLPVHVAPLQKFIKIITDFIDLFELTFQLFLR